MVATKDPLQVYTGSVEAAAMTVSGFAVTVTVAVGVVGVTSVGAVAVSFPQALAKIASTGRAHENTFLDSFILWFLLLKGGTRVPAS
jgi:hypothetical protein